MSSKSSNYHSKQNLTFYNLDLVLLRKLQIRLVLDPPALILFLKVLQNKKPTKESYRQHRIDTLDKIAVHSDILIFHARPLKLSENPDQIP